MDVVLVRVQDDGSQRPLKLREGRTTFGRGDDVTVKVPIAGVSRHHCAIDVSEDGSIKLVDLGSSNGTFVNQERATERGLAGGDLVSFGGLVFLVQVNGEPGDIDAELMFEDGLPEGDVTPAPSHVGNAPKPKAANDSDAGMSDSFDFDFDDEDEDDQPPL